MKLSVNWIKQLTSLDSTIDELVEKIGAQLGAVEEVIDTGKKYEGLLVVKVVECVKHPNADKLSLCLVDDGGVNKKVERKAGDLIQIVCGAPNVKAGMLAVWIPPGATVPASYDKEPFVIEARPIRNKTSHGMLASAMELDIGNDHSGIVEIDKDAKPGDDFAELYKMNDYIIDIENKMFTHRPDLFGHIGLAREIAGIQGHSFTSPDWYKESAALPSDGRKNVLKLSVKNDVPELVPRFCAVAIKDIKIGPSPLWLRASLSRLGVNSVNNIVDITNFYMLLSAQPLHAYDYDKVKTGVLGARLTKSGEKISLLNGKELTMEEGTVVITDGHRPIGLAGIMGGADTEVDENTKNIILEVASFDMNQTRRTAMEYGIFSDAATRFTKNQSPRQNMAVLCKAVEDIKRLAGGRVASPVADDRHFKAASQTVNTDADFINSRLGLSLSVMEIRKLLENVEFGVEGTRDLKITAPFWRTDIEIPEDIVEEVGRLYGYDKLPVVLPARDLAAADKNAQLEFKSSLRDILRRAGANEVLTYSFVHERLLKAAAQDPKNAYHIRNAVSPDLQFYRLSLVPSLLDKVRPNIKAGFSDFALFELGKGHLKGELDDGLPLEVERLALVIASKKPKAGAAYFGVKRICDYLLGELGVSPEYRQMSSNQTSKTATYYEPARSAELIVDGNKIGRVGEFKHSVGQTLKLPEYCAGFTLDINKLQKLAAPHDYQPLNRYPEIEQDINLRTSIGLSYGVLTAFIVDHLQALSKDQGYKFRIEPLDIFQRPDDKHDKQTTWRIILSHPERTLTTEETNKLLDELAGSAKKELKAERV
jgi:phenylalanyl-tRNA synthetase beta chain